MPPCPNWLIFSIGFTSWHEKFICYNANCRQGADITLRVAVFLYELLPNVNDSHL
jgi:hypothetical protein